MVEEQKQQLLEMLNKLYEDIRPFVEIIIKIWEAVREIVTKIYIQLIEFLKTKILIKTKSFKKGKRFIHGYKKIELWKWVKLNDKS